ncbi:MAG TPA: site-specific integrase [Nitrososphaeraceae archaeon]
MQKEDAYSNFVNSIDSEKTKEVYQYSLNRFLQHYQTDLDSFLSLSQQEMSDLIVNYLTNKKVSRQYKIVIFSAIMHCCQMNDVILNWKKIKKFIKYERTDNAINGKDRPYFHSEIQKILEFSDQRLKTTFLVLASTGMRIGALSTIRIGDLERIDDLYKIIVYSGDKEEYFTFTTPECTKEIDAYLDFRTRRGEQITQDSYLIVRKFSHITPEKGKPFKDRALRSLLQKCIDNTGLRQIDHGNPHKRKQIPIFHGFRKFFTKQLVDSKLNPEIREMLLGHKIGLASAYYKPTVQDMLNEYLKGVNLLTINEENRLKEKVEKLEIEKSQFEALKHDFEAFKKELRSKR